MTNIQVSTRMKTPSRQRMWKTLTPFAYLSPTLILLAVLALIPIATVFYYSLMDNVIITRDAPSFVGLENYAETLSDDKFHQAFHHTLFLAGVSVIAHSVLGLLFALLLT